MMNKDREAFEAWFSGSILPASPCHEYYTKEALEWTWQSALAHHQPLLDAKDAEIVRLKERLEITHVYDNEGNKQPAPEGMPDGIECRDSTIDLLDEERNAMREEISTIKALLEQAGNLLLAGRTGKNIESSEVYECLTAINAATGEK